MIDLSGIASKNCSDALELKIRWAAEIALPSIMPQLDGKAQEHAAAALAEFAKLSQAIADLDAQTPINTRIGSFTKPPRSTRYEAGAALCSYPVLMADRVCLHFVIRCWPRAPTSTARNIHYINYSMSSSSCPLPQNSHQLTYCSHCTCTCTGLDCRPDRAQQPTAPQR